MSEPEHKPKPKPNIDVSTKTASARPTLFGRGLRQHVSCSLTPRARPLADPEPRDRHIWRLDRKLARHVW